MVAQMFEVGRNVEARASFRVDFCSCCREAAAARRNAAWKALEVE